MSIFVCIMTLLCPVVCMAELDAHQDEHGKGQDPAHATKDCEHPDQQHDPSGDPAPHGEHSCLCTGGTPPGAALQIPAMQPAAIIAADDFSLANLDTASLMLLLNARDSTDISTGLRCAPLLI